MLYFERFPVLEKHQSITLPTLVFLHGLLGSGEDWQSCINALPEYERVTVDLPGHGHSQSISCCDLNDCCKLLNSTLSLLFPSQQPLILIGYSMGGRITMHGIAHQCFPDLNIAGAIVEGGNFGLQTESEKQVRLENDARWAMRFKTEPLERVLNDWYQQAVFSSLNHEQRQTFIAKRSDNLGSAVANMLMATSLAKQAYLLPSLQKQNIPVYYLCGEKDQKFSQLAQRSGLAYRQVEGAGHNVHQEQPKQFAIHTKQIIQSHFGESNENNGNHHG
ncbi:MULTISPECIES: 2-succinyl-6-hydroxy-2,4-cyclohexadiene-1-carboxylate synthase [Vibrio]|uniref:2-succinyl-6-hydroxy-2, 4-cyclohexadiene-1-carboxylate synthase n=1 Tax=Vibrio TaxID=662 RepID=UPI00102D6A47|nr:MULTISPECIES: 2-succinyl-6-hydroxy-2,4-cyclohexadiene-1-carboxylate synthase [Vibrio]EIO9264384.1 2-succinyl-6-hydroxy-2,4-cyclohexadiene-1-carboxylate synthase [Vibrio alginolyticus]ELB2946729.1 2-succinyl-6-hydroxy-2,4-cyclohexadiene-1-carboxylate synthase [Vibrio alginolyticus]MCA2439888.1 2-succinyl-6-hydroxy-2,4-cyclohexadiene-1-carboxylate synthase [Vibrio alginolyticus]MDW1730062.1 2-succinyl-6-hydroxy-2,4-cyclohexadiene-1-carboxylate synthase [Vibrio sp. Vb2356]MDW1932486.1 2-succin